MDDVGATILVSLFQVLQNAVLYPSLAVWRLLVLYYLQGYECLDFVVVGSNHLAKGATTHLVEDLESVCHMVVQLTEVVTLFVVESYVLLAFGLSRWIFTHEVHSVVLEYLCLLEECKVMSIFRQDFLGSHGCHNQIVTFWRSLLRSLLCRLWFILRLLSLQLLNIPLELPTCLLATPDQVVLLCFEFF